MKIGKGVVRLALTLLGIGGVALTGYLSAKCQDKAKDKKTLKEKAVAFGPAIVSGLATSACIAFNHKLSTNEIAALTATATYAVANRDKLESAVRKTLEPEKANDICKSSIPVIECSCVENTGRGSTKFLDSYSGKKFYSNIESVIRAEEGVTRKLCDGEYVRVNDLYRGWNVAPTEFGETHVWIPDEDYYSMDPMDNPIGFEHDRGTDFDGSDLIIITVASKPQECWDYNDLVGQRWSEPVQTSFKYEDEE